MNATGTPDAPGAAGVRSLADEHLLAASTTAELFASAAVELFVYYRVPLAQAADALAAARDCQRRLRAAHPRLTARLLCRAEPTDEHETWMETYRIETVAAPAALPGDAAPAGQAAEPARGSAGIDAALQSAIEANALPLARFIAGPRHVERFTACA